jgi:hypothetical protein
MERKDAQDGDRISEREMKVGEYIEGGVFHRRTILHCEGTSSVDLTH